MNRSLLNIVLAAIMSMLVLMPSAFAQHLKKDGTPDMRYKENRVSDSSSNSRSSSDSYSSPHVRNDGQPDMRYR
jgi:hypothetical protein